MNFTEWLNLRESFLGEYPFPQYHLDVKVYKNPLYRELMGLLTKSKYGSLKGLALTNKDELFIWDGGDVIHSEMIEKLLHYGEITPDVGNKVYKFYINYDKTNQIPVLNDYFGNIQNLEELPSIKKMMGPALQPQKVGV